MLIRTRMALNFGAVFILLGIAAYFTFVVLSEYTVSVSEVTSARISREHLLLKGQSLVADIHTTVLESASVHSKSINETIDILDSMALDFYATLEGMRGSKYTDETVLRELYRSFQTYYLFSKMLIRRSWNTVQHQDSIVHYKKMYKRLNHEMQDYYASSDSMLVEALQAKVKRIRKLKNFFAIISFVLLLGLILISFSLYRAIGRPLTSLSESIQQYMVSGQFTLTESGSSDEVAAISRKFNEIASVISDRERRLEAASNEFKSIFDNSWEGIARSNLDGEIVTASPGMIKLFGYDSMKDMQQEAKCVRDLFIDHGLSDEMFARLSNGNDRIEYETQFVRQDGQAFWGRCRVRYYLDNEGDVSGYTYFVSDISAQKREEELQSAKVAAEEANLAKTNFLATMSHELRTPINAMLGMTEVLDETGKSTKQERCINTIKAAGKQLLSVINNILSFSEIESGYLRIKQSPFSVAAVADELATLFTPMCQQKGIVFDYSIRQTIRGVRIGDSERLAQVLVNIIGNAIKFTKEGSINLDVADEAGSDMITFSVIDTGIGIPEYLQKQIFSPFVQNEKSMSRRFGGSGLGLAITKRIVEKLGGEIRLNSQVGIGTTVQIKLPLQFAEASAVSTEDTQNQSNYIEKFSGMNLLIVDDSEANRNLVELFLDTSGAFLHFADCGLRGVEMAMKSKYNAILMDIEMPEMNGLEATRKIREYEKEHDLLPTPIIVVTAHVFDEFKINSKEAGATDYLAKPFNKRQLLSILTKHFS